MTHIKLYRRGEICELAGEYLMVISKMDGGDWVASRVQSAQTLLELKEALRRNMADTGGIVMRGSREFERLAFELGLRHLNSEWGNQ